VGISFDHMHMGDLLRLVHEHPEAEIAGLFDPDPAAMARAIAQFGIPSDRVFTWNARSPLPGGTSAVRAAAACSTISATGRRWEAGT
jgi:glucose-fructose oxidoreductase